MTNDTHEPSEAEQKLHSAQDALYRARLHLLEIHRRAVNLAEWMPDPEEADDAFERGVREEQLSLARNQYRDADETIFELEQVEREIARARAAWLREREGVSA